MKKNKLFIALLILVSFFCIKVSAKGYIGQTVFFTQSYEKKYVTDEDKARIMEDFGLSSWDGSVLVHHHEDGQENAVTFRIDYSRTNLASTFPTVQDYMDEQGISVLDDFDEDFLPGSQCIVYNSFAYADDAIFNLQRTGTGKLRFGAYAAVTDAEYNFLGQDTLICSSTGDFENDTNNYLLYRFESEGLGLLRVDGDDNTAGFLVFYEEGDNTSDVLHFKNGSTEVSSMEVTAIRDFRSNIFTVPKTAKETSAPAQGYFNEFDAVAYKHALGLSEIVSGYNSLGLISTDGHSLTINPNISSLVEDDVVGVVVTYGAFARDDENNLVRIDDGFTFYNQVSIFGRRYEYDYDNYQLADTGLNAFDEVTILPAADAETEAEVYDADNDSWEYEMVPANFVQVSYKTLSGRTYDFVYTYDTEENRNLFNFDHVSDTADPEEVPEYYVYDVEEKGILSINEMRTIIANNQLAPIEIRTGNGIIFTFAKNSMSLVNGMDDYAFGTYIELSYAAANVPGIENDVFIEKVHFDYQGDLPGMATIKIPVGTDWSNKKVQYGLYSAGSLQNAVEYVVDNNGYITASQNHCSDYVIIASDNTGGGGDDPPPPGPTIVRGDFSGDGNVAFNDVVFGLRKVFGYLEKTDDDVLLGDLNNNGGLDFADIIVLLRYVFGYIDTI